MARKKGVLLSIERYEQLTEDLHDLAVVAERKGEERINFDEMKIEDLRWDPFPANLLGYQVPKGFIAFELETAGSFTKLIPRQRRSPSITFVPEALHIAICETSLVGQIMIFASCRQQSL